jgi:phosphatidylinositol glycan class A protein
MIKFAEPTVNDLVDALSEAISISRRVIPNELHERLKIMYSWYDVALRTEKVYHHIKKLPNPSFVIRILRYTTLGFSLGLVIIFITTFLKIYAFFCEYFSPIREIEICPDFPWLIEKSVHRKPYLHSIDKATRSYSDTSRKKSHK